MRVLLTYDVSIRQTDVKREMLSRGFHHSWVVNQITYYLPDTTLWHSDIASTEHAKNLFTEVINMLNRNQPNQIRIKRLIVVEFSSWAGIPGDSHS